MGQRNIARKHNIKNTSEGYDNHNLSLTHILPHKQSVKIYHQNIRSLRNKMNELLCHLNHDPPHTEHQLHHDELGSLHIDSYTLGAYYCRKSKQKGGVCMFVYNSIKFTSLNTDSCCLDQDFEVCAIHLNSVYDKLCILAFYRSRLGNFNIFLTNFDLILHKFCDLKFNFIICGGINVNYLAESYKEINSTILYSPLISVALSIFLLEKDQILFQLLTAFCK